MFALDRQTERRDLVAVCRLLLDLGIIARVAGVSICHLVRRGNINAVFVSRWRWNGQAREREPVPDTTTAFTDDA